MAGPPKPRPHSGREVESSNSTANLFLNGRVRKPWMASTTTPFDISATVAASPTRDISSSVSGDLRPSSSSPPPPPLFNAPEPASQGMRNPPSQLPHPPRAPSTQSPVTCDPATDAACSKDAGVNPQEAPTATSVPEAALMSPVTPDETLQHQQQLLQQLNDASSTAMTTPAAAATTNATSATTTGASINPVSGSGVSHSLPSPDPSNLTHPSPSSAVDRTSEDPALRIVSSSAVGPAAQAHSPQQQNPPVARDTSLPSGFPAGEEAQPPVSSSAVVSSQQHGRQESAPMIQSQSPPSVMPAPANYQPTQPEAAGLKLDDSFWTQSHVRAETFSEHFIQVSSSAEAVELPRIRLLRDACISRDLLYLALHQIYCFSTMAPSQFASFPEFVGHSTSGIRVLEQLLVENQRLPVDFLRWCVDFPGPPHVMRANSQYRAAMQQVSHSLALLDQHWASYDSCVRARGYPPLVEELVVCFGITSSTTMLIIFLAMSRRLYGCRHELQLKNLWHQNRHSYNTRLSSNRSPEQVRRENEQLIQTYLSLNPMRTHSPQTMAVPASLVTPQPVNNAQPLFTASDQQNLTRPQHFVPPPQQQSPHLATPTTMVAPGNRGQAMRPVRSQDKAQQPASRNHRAPAPAPAPASNSNPQPRANGPATNPFTEGINKNIHPTFGIIQQMFGPLPTPIDTGSRPRAEPARVPAQQSSAPSRRGQTRANNTAAQQSESAASGTRGPGAQPQQARQTSHAPLLPAPGSTPPNMVCPNPLRVGLHQAHLREPMLQMVHTGSNGPEETLLFLYLHHFKLNPSPLGLVETAFHWQFSLTSAEHSRLPRSTSRGIGERQLRMLSEGNHVHRIRCIKVPPNFNVNTNMWNATETVWPSVLYVFVNNTELFVRRKVHNGKDLPLDISEYLQEGVNTVSIHLLRNAEESNGVFYMAGVEVLEVAEYAHVRRLTRVLPPEESRAQIQQRLTSRAEDEELSIINDDLTINLVDPFMARIFDIPARGDKCAHRECFDRDTFLMTRTSKSGVGPMNENWKCPICGENVNPQNLIIDGFLGEVHEELRRTNRLDCAKAIVIKADGSWELKVDKDAQSNEHPEERQPTTTAAATVTGGDSASKRKHSNVAHGSPFPRRLKTEVTTPGSGGASVACNSQSPQTPDVIELD